MNILRTGRYLLWLLSAWSIFLFGYLIVETPQFTYWFRIASLEPALLCAAECDCPRLHFLADRVWSVRDLSAPNDCLCFQKCNILWRPDTHPSPAAARSRVSDVVSTTSEPASHEQIVSCVNLTNATNLPYQRTTRITRNILLAKAGYISSIYTTRQSVPSSQLQAQAICVLNNETGEVRVKTMPSSDTSLPWQASQSASGLPECGRNKSCLEEVFVAGALEKALRADKAMWQYLLQETDYPHEVSTSINATCDPDDNILLVYVHTHPEHRRNRDIIRRTWGGVGQTRGVRILVAFGLGRSDKPHIQAAIRDEVRQFADIIQGNFVDSYANLTLKHDMGLQWLYEHCADSAYFLKLDDDVALNVYRVVDLLVDVLPWTDAPSFYCSEVWPKPRPQRAGKWAVSVDDYTQSVFPGSMCPGRAYIVPTSLALRMAVLASHVRFFWLDDVWATSFLGTLAGAKYISATHRPFNTDSLTFRRQHCFYDITHDLIEKQPEVMISKWRHGNTHYQRWQGDNTPPC